MDDQLQEDWLETRLREEAPYIDDAGFTAAVVQKLSARRATRASVRGVLLLAITVVACVVTYFISNGGSFLVAAVNTLVAMPLWIIAVVAVFCGVVGTVTAAGIAYVQAREEPLG